MSSSEGFRKRHYACMLARRSERRFWARHHTGVYFDWKRAARPKGFSFQTGFEGF